MMMMMMIMMATRYKTLGGRCYTTTYNLVKLILGYVTADNDSL